MTCTLDATWASCRSSVGPAGSCHCHGLWRNPRELVQLVCSSRFGWGGPTLHTLARRDSPASPRSARPTRRFPHWSQAARSRLALMCAGGQGTLPASARRVAHAETARVGLEAAPRRPAAPGRRVAFRTDRRRQGRAWHVAGARRCRPPGLAARPARGARERPWRPVGPGPGAANRRCRRSRRPSRPPRRRRP